MSFNPQTTREILTARGVSLIEAAGAAEISPTRFGEMLEGQRTPSAKQIERLSESLAVPPYAFFRSQFDLVDDGHELIDFRKTNPTPFKVGLHAPFFQRIFRLRRLIKTLQEKFKPEEVSLLTTEQNENPEQLAQAYRALLRLDEIQFDSELGMSRFYGEFRKRVENLGVFVMQGSLRDENIKGFALFDASDSEAKTHVIVINTYYQNHNARAFTLAHELAHLALRTSAISDLYEISNSVELFCNKFAANLLAPRARFNDFAERTFAPSSSRDEQFEQAKTIARHFRISIAAALLRLIELDFASWPLFQAWREKFIGKKPPDALLEIRRSKNSVPPDAGKNALSRLGLRFASLIKNAVAHKLISNAELFEKTNLSAETLDRLNKAAPDQLFELISGDE